VRRVLKGCDRSRVKRTTKAPHGRRAALKPVADRGPKHGEAPYFYSDAAVALVHYPHSLARRRFDTLCAL